MSVASLFELPCVMLPDERLVTSAGRSLTYTDVRRRSIRLAAALQGTATEGSGVAILSTNHPVWLEALLAASRLGTHLVALNFRAREDELREMLRQGAAGIVLVEPRYLDLVESAVRGL